MMSRCKGLGCESTLIGSGEELDREHGYEVIICAGKRLYRGASTSWAWRSISEIPWADKLMQDQDSGERYEETL